MPFRDVYKRQAMSGFLAVLGDRRPAMVDFMKGFVSGTEYILFDGTRIPSHSDNMLNACLLYTSRCV